GAGDHLRSGDAQAPALCATRQGCLLLPGVLSGREADRNGLEKRREWHGQAVVNGLKQEERKRRSKGPGRGTKGDSLCYCLTASDLWLNWSRAEQRGFRADRPRGPSHAPRSPASTVGR